jgi:hypothetical protein
MDIQKIYNIVKTIQCVHTCDWKVMCVRALIMLISYTNKTDPEPSQVFQRSSYISFIFKIIGPLSLPISHTPPVGNSLLSLRYFLNFLSTALTAIQATFFYSARKVTIFFFFWVVSELHSQPP